MLRSLELGLWSKTQQGMGYHRGLGWQLLCRPLEWVSLMRSFPWFGDLGRGRENGLLIRQRRIGEL